MKLKWVKPSSLDRNLKASVHRSGKLGFTMDAADKLELSANKSVSIAVNEADDEDLNLYVVVHDEVLEDAYKVNKAGDYYYVNLKYFFDTMKIEYEDGGVSYDIVLEEVDGNRMYVFKRRMIRRKKNKSVGAKEE